MSRPRNGGAQLGGLAVVPDAGNGKAVARDVQPAFEGTIAGFCETVIGVEEFIGMARWAKESDPMVAQFLEAWEALSASEQRLTAADAICKRIGLAPLDLLKAIAEASCRVATYRVQMIAALSHPLVVKKTIDLALNAGGATGEKTRLAAQVVLHKATGFLSTPKGSQTTISVTQQNAHLNANGMVPRPEDTIRTLSLSERLNQLRGVTPQPRPLPAQPAMRSSTPDDPAAVPPQTGDRR